MDANLIYMILGVIATIIVGYFGIKYTSKHKSKTSLLFFENSCISLFKTVVKELDELEVKYKGQTVNENLISYKGTFFNSGNIDIDKNLIHKPLNVVLPENYEWKKVKIIDKSKDINIFTEERPNKLQFSWDILKENEFFTFDSVIEYKPKSKPKKDDSEDNYSITRNLSKNISFTQRITNLKDIDKERIPSKPIGWVGQLFLNLYLLGFVVLGLYWSAGQFVFPNYKTMYEVQMDSTLSYVTLENKGEDKIQLIDSLGNDLMIKSINQINEKILTGKIKSQKNDLSYLGLIGGGLIALIMLFLIIVVTNQSIKEKRLYNRIKQIADKYDNMDFTERRHSRLFLLP